MEPGEGGGKKKGERRWCKGGIREEDSSRLHARQHRHTNRQTDMLLVNQADN